ncbi:hypothetical protein B0O80DRAFT_475928 [Mortierella sp. GBAus27b]|nr:hypothetical protein B0O80DRAFT_475928 [Mortierella sp. GBAus27b]
MDKVFCGTADGRSILKSTMKQVCRLQDNGISGIACACYKIQLCINDALEQCKEASAVLKRFNDFLKLLGRESNAEETSGGSQHLQQQRDYFRKSYFWKPPTTYCKSSIEGDDGRLYWCSLYLLVRDHGATLFNDSRERAWSDNVNLHYEEKLNQAQLTQKEAETLEAILPVLEPLFESWALISSGSDSDSDNDNKFGSHEGGGLGRVNQASDISKVYPAIHGIIETVAASTVAHPTAKALGRALVRQLKRHWNLDEIPDAVLMATYLDPATAGSPIFKSTVERNKTRVDLKSHARSLIVQMVQRTLGQPRDYGEAAVTDTDSTHSTSALSKELHAEFVAYYSAVMQDPPETLWDDPRPWWQGHGSDMPHLSSVARSCFSIQATSLPPAQLFDGTQGTEGILADPRGRSNEYTFIRLLTVRNLHRFLHGDGASQLDMADLV